MHGPRGPFTPWIEHPLEDGRCLVCGLVPPAHALATHEPARVYTHAGGYLTCRPSGRILMCTQEAV